MTLAADQHSATPGFVEKTALEVYVAPDMPSLVGLSRPELSVFSGSYLAELSRRASLRGGEPVTPDSLLAELSITRLVEAFPMPEMPQ